MRSPSGAAGSVLRVTPDLFTGFGVGRKDVIGDRPRAIVRRADLERLAPRVVQLRRIATLDISKDVLNALRRVVVVLDHVGLEGLRQADRLDLGDVLLV